MARTPNHLADWVFVVKRMSRAQVGNLDQRRLPRPYRFDFGRLPLNIGRDYPLFNTFDPKLVGRTIKTHTFHRCRAFVNYVKPEV